MNDGKTIEQRYRRYFRITRSAYLLATMLVGLYLEEAPKVCTAFIETAAISGNAAGQVRRSRA